VRQETARLLKHGFQPLEGYPMQEPQEVVVGMDAGHVIITIGEGTLLFTPDQALDLGNEIVRCAGRCAKR
jgi:hypothetical protein